MAKLPGYDSKQGMTTDVGTVKRDIGAEMQTGKNITAIGKAAQDIATVWQDAKDFSETLTKQTADEKEINTILQEAEADPDHTNDAIYKERIRAIKDRMGEGFSSNIAQKKYSVFANNAVAAAEIKVDGLFRGKTIDHTKGQIVEQHEINKQLYIKTGDWQYQQKQKELVELARQKGFVNEIFTANETIKVDDWEKLRYLQVAETDPEAAVDMVKNSDMNPTEKAAALNNIKSIASQGDIKREIAATQQNIKTTTDIETFVDDPTKTYVEKLDAIEQAERFGYPAKDVTRMKAYLTSKEKEAAQSHDKEFAMAVEMIGTLEGGLKKPSKKDAPFKDSLEYMRSVKDTKDFILDMHTKGRITLEEKNKLNESLAAKTATEAKHGMKSIGKDRSWLNPGNWFNYSYDDARIDFQKQFNKNEAKVNAAMKRYFYAVEGEKLSGRERKDKMAEIVDVINGDARDATVAQMETIRKAVPKNLSDEEILKANGFSEDDVTYTMQQTGKSRQEVINHLRGR
jgi:hypothetical protein